MYVEDIQDYYQGLCESHADIRHGLEGRTAFFRLQGMGEMSQLPNKAGDVLVIMERFSGRTIGEYDTNKLQQSIVIRFAKLMDIPVDGDFETAIGACMDAVYLIMLDFLSKMRYDFAADSCSWLKYVDFASISWTDFQGPAIERHYGWDLTIPFIAAAPEYRDTKWINV